MSLILTIANCDRLENGQSARLVLDRHGAVIGRAATADWSLPDPKHYISATHCEIAYSGSGDYLLIDRSTNGTFVNGSGERIGEPYRLIEGDEITVGHYRISVRLTGAGPRPEANAAPGKSGWGWPERPTAEKPKAWGADSDEGSKPAWRFERNESAEPHRSAPSASAAPAWGNSDIDPRWTFADNKPAQPQQPSPAWDNSDRGWGNDEMRGTGQMSGHFAPPAARTTPGNASVWDSFSVANEVNWDKPQAGAPVTQAPEQNAKHPSVGDWQDLTTPLPKSIAAAVTGHAGAPDTDAAWLVLLTAAGLSPTDIKGSSIGAATTAGGLLRRLVKGLVAMLEARARAREALGIGTTSFNPDGNNPLKFILNGDDPLARLLSPHERGFTGAERAVDDAHKDLQAHQMATLAATQSALRATLARFSPQAIRDRAEAGGFLARIVPGARASALWEAYEREFEGVVKGSDEAFMEVFAKAFRDAYTRALAEPQGGGARANSEAPPSAPTMGDFR